MQQGFRLHDVRLDDKNVKSLVEDNTVPEMDKSSFFNSGLTSVRTSLNSLSLNVIGPCVETLNPKPYTLNRVYWQTES